MVLLGRLWGEGREGEKRGKEGKRMSLLPIIIFATTLSPNLLDPALRRPGRLEREIVISSPNIDTRFKILTAVTSGVPLEGGEGGEGGWLRRVAEETSGYVGRDLVGLCRGACMGALKGFEKDKVYLFIYFNFNLFIY